MIATCHPTLSEAIFDVSASADHRFRWRGQRPMIRPAESRSPTAGACGWMPRNCGYQEAEIETLSLK